MRSLKKAIIAAVLGALIPGVAMAWPWSWDMFDQRSHKAQEEPAPPMPEGIVPVDGKPYYVESRGDAASLANPFEPTASSVERGRLQYSIYCSTCHGDTGKGEGLVGQKYIPPTDLTSGYIQTKPDGDIYFTITYGGLAIMPSYGDSMDPEDRWHIVNYIKHGLIQEVAAD